MAKAYLASLVCPFAKLSGHVIELTLAKKQVLHISSSSLKINLPSVFRALQLIPQTR
jgi:hypothetical protein